MTTDQVLLGTGLILVLAVGSQVLAAQLRIPALIIMLPAGFTAGALTEAVNPQKLLGSAFEPLVSLAVAVILYDAGLSLAYGVVRGRARRVVPRLVFIGVPITCAIGAACAVPILGMSVGAALMTGAILVVSGPTVVGPILEVIRPNDRLKRLLSWEGSLIDPVGGILGAVMFYIVLNRTSHTAVHAFAQLLVSVGIGVAGAAVGIAALWFCLRKLHLGDLLGTSAQLACVVAVAAACDTIRDDSGLIAAVLMGLVVANARSFDMPARRPFFETLVGLIIGVLFVTISATVTPASVRHLMLPTLGLVAVLVLLARPLVAYIATFQTGLTRGERVFIGWMAPRGIVAAATASTFGTKLAAKHVDGASKILPVTFLVIVATVAVYGLTARPLAHRLGVTLPGGTRPLLVGGGPWVIDLARAFRTAGLDVLMWAPSEQGRAQIRAASFELAPGEQLASATRQGSKVEGVNTILLLTEEDDFNALAASNLAGDSETPVYRLAPRDHSHGVVVPYNGSETLFAPHLTHGALSAHRTAGARITTTRADGNLALGNDILFRISPGHGDKHAHSDPCYNLPPSHSTGGRHARTPYRRRTSRERCDERRRLSKPSAGPRTSAGRRAGTRGASSIARQLRDMKGSVDVEAATAVGLTLYARVCGWTLARAHARSSDPIAIAEYLGDSDAFDKSVTDFSKRYADKTSRITSSS